jgi:glycosyltransferase involved in cell wall biosynthesis
VDALVERLRALHRDPDLRARMALAARARAEEFTWAHYGARLSAWLDKELGVSG